MKLAKTILKNELLNFEEVFKDNLKNHNPLLGKIIQSLPYREGKLLRPILIFLSARLNGTIKDNIYPIACMVEYIHLNNKIQQAIVEQTIFDQNRYTAHALWNNQIAIQAGNFMVAKSFSTATENKAYRIMALLSEAIQRMSDASLLQIEKERTFKMNEALYYTINLGKSAYLFAVSCAAGAYSINGHENNLQIFFKLGENIGMAFHIKQDIIDYSSSLLLGKLNFNSFKSKMNTLPVLYAIEHATEKQKKAMLKIFSKDEADEKELWEIVDIIRNSGGIDYASKIMLRYREEAFRSLYQLPTSLERLAMEELIYFITEKTV